MMRELLLHHRRLLWFGDELSLFSADKWRWKWHWRSIR